MLDRDLAALYQVKPIALRQAVTRNKSRFPPDFHFQLANGEAKVLLSQPVIPSQPSLGGHLPYVEIMRTLVRSQEMLSANTDRARKLTQLEAKYDAQFKVVFDAIR